MASEPSVGQPYSPPMGLRFSLGDPSTGATPASPAYQGVTIGAAGDVAPPIVVSLAATANITLTTYLRAADDFGGGWLTPRITVPPATVEHHIRNVETGAVVGAFPGGTIVAMGGSPSGAGTAAVGETVNWFSATSAAIPTGAVAGGLGGVGTYQILTHVHGNGVNAATLAVFKDDTYIMVTP